MDWNYFLDDGEIKAKRLPAIKSTAVKIKDTSDLYDLRQEFRDTNSPRDIKMIYQHVFDHPSMYDIEMEDFEESINRNGKQFLGNLTSFKNNTVLLFDLVDHAKSDQRDKFILLPTKISKQLIKNELAVKKDIITDDDWIEYLTNEHTISSLKEIANTQSKKIAGTKRILVQKLFALFLNGEISIPPPILIRLTSNFPIWFSNLQKKYVAEIEVGPATFDYPETYKAAVFDLALDTNFEVICEVIEENHHESLELNKLAHTSSSHNLDLGIKITTYRL